MTTAPTAGQLTRPGAVLFPDPETHRQELVFFARLFADLTAAHPDYGRIALKGVRYLSIDEIYVGKRRGYYTLVMDLESGRIVWVSPGRGKASLMGFWPRLRRSRSRIGGSDYCCPSLGSTSQTLR